MRLLRLFTRDPNAVFENNFNSDIIIKPYSKIALQSVSFEVKPDVLVVDSNNDELEYQITNTGGIRTITLEHATYYHSTIDNLLEDIYIKLNASLLATVSGDIGVEWQAKLNNDNKVLVEYQRGKNVSVLSYVLNNVVRTNPPGNGEINAPYFSSNTGTDTNAYTNLLYNTNFLARGGGLFNGRIQELVDNTGASDTNGCIFGLTDRNIDNEPGKVITNNIIKLAIVVGKPTENYGILEDGVVGAPLVNFPPNKVNRDANASRNDNLQIVIEEGKLRAKILYYDNTQPDNRGYVTLYETDYDGKKQLYPFIIFRGEETYMKISKAQFYQSPYNQKLHADEIIFNEDELGIAPPPQATRFSQFFSFEDSTIYKFLGYDQGRFPLAGTNDIKNISLVASYVVGKIDINELYIVETLNLKLNSYDGYSEERRSILATIPKKVDNTIVNYEPNEKIFVDIDNAEPISLRNLSAIIRNNDLSFIETKGLASLTVVIKDNDE